MPKLKSTAAYDKKLKKFARKNPGLRGKYSKVITLLQKNPYHSSLKLHKLHGALAHLHSISINYEFRVTLEFEIRDDFILLVNIGSHDELY